MKIYHAYLVVRDYLRLFRVHHYIKNLLIFVSLVFSLSFADLGAVQVSFLGFVFFCLLSSIIYIVNDLKDIEKDRLHPVKRLRPLAAGRISAHSAIVSCVVLLTMALAILLLILMMLDRGYINIKSDGGGASSFMVVTVLALLYAVLNIAYSFGLKNIPILDITILASGYVIRVLFGAALSNIEVSVWLYLTVTVGAFFLGFGKRRNELLKNGTATRKVSALYSHNFLDKCMYMCEGLCVVFYALWSIDSVTISRLGTGAFVYTIPLVLIILFKYDLIIECESEADPVQVVLGDKTLLLLCTVYVALMIYLVYAGCKQTI